MIAGLQILDGPSVHFVAPVSELVVIPYQSVPPHVHIVPYLSEGTCWSSDSVRYFLESSGSKDQLPGH